MKTLDFNASYEVWQFDELDESTRRLVDRAIKACDNSYSPYSHFSVGACLRLEDGTEIIGANQENAAYPSGLCAERSAIFASQAQYPDKAIVELAIAARNTEGELTKVPTAPCGACRQVILEIEDRYQKPVRIILYGSEATYIINSIKDILPLCFIGSSLQA